MQLKEIEEIKRNSISQWSWGRGQRQKCSWRQFRSVNGGRGSDFTSSSNMTWKRLHNLKVCQS